MPLVFGRKVVAMALTSSRSPEEKGEPYRPPISVARELTDKLRYAKAGHFPVYEGERLVGVFVSEDQFNILVHLGELLDDPEVAAAVTAARREKEKKDSSYLSFEKVFG
jgi:hypothetical protein